MAAVPSPPVRPAPPLDEEGRFRMRGHLSGAVIGAYVLLLAVVLLVIGPRDASTIPWVPYGLAALIVFLLVRYLSTTYTLDDTDLRAWRLLGGRRVPLAEVRKIEYASLRDLGPTGGWFGLGSWGWRGRMWSPFVGEFDSVYTDAANGLLVTQGEQPLYLSPSHRDRFARELSRRVRSYTGPLERDVGFPAAPQ